MTQRELDNLESGDVLCIENPRSASAASLLRIIRSIEAVDDYTKVAVVDYYAGGRAVGRNRCELNLNLFGSMKIVKEIHDAG